MDSATANVSSSQCDPLSSGRSSMHAIALGQSLIGAMRSRRQDTLTTAVLDIDVRATQAGSRGGDRHRVSRKLAAERELLSRAGEIWGALRKACEASLLPFREDLSTLLKQELRSQLAIDRTALETQIAPNPLAAPLGRDTLPMDLADAVERARVQIEPEIDLFTTALKNGVASGYAYSADAKATAMAIPQKSDGTPLVFISYSHDSDEHKGWVRRLAENLVNKGVDVILDQWHLKHGRDLAFFMETGITTADYVLMICTEGYVSKANERAGGVGYESLFLTGELLRKVNTEKLIPVVRQLSEPRKRPSFVTSRLFADLSDESHYDAQLEELLRTLHDAPRYRAPPRGANPFVRSDGDELRPAGGASASDAHPREMPAPVTSVRAMNELPSLPIEVFEHGQRTIATGDVLRWNQIREKALVVSRQALMNWRVDSGRKLPGDGAAAKSWTFDLLSTHASVLALAVAGALSTDERVWNQAPLIDRVINIEEWDGSGMTMVVEAPQSIAWSMHLFAGAALIYVGRLDAAFSLARSKVHLERPPKMIVESPSLTGWPPTLRDSNDAWRFITGLRDNWPWLDTVFGDKTSYRAMLTTYLLALSITEFAERVRRGEQFENDSAQRANLWVPLRFIGEDSGIQQRAYQAIVSHPTAVQDLFPRDASRSATLRQWTHWLSFCAQAGRSEYRYGGTDQLARYADLIPSALSS